MIDIKQKFLNDLDYVIYIYDDIYNQAVYNNFELEGKYNIHDLKLFINMCNICLSLRWKEYMFVNDYYKKNFIKNHLGKRTNAFLGPNKKIIHYIRTNRLLTDYLDNINLEVFDINRNLKDLLNSYSDSRYYINCIWKTKFTIKDFLIRIFNSWDFNQI